MQLCFHMEQICASLVHTAKLLFVYVSLLGAERFGRMIQFLSFTECSLLLFISMQNVFKSSIAALTIKYLSHSCWEKLYSFITPSAWSCLAAKIRTHWLESGRKYGSLSPQCSKEWLSSFQLRNRSCCSQVWKQPSTILQLIKWFWKTVTKKNYILSWKVYIRGNDWEILQSPVFFLFERLHFAQMKIKSIQMTVFCINEKRKTFVLTTLFKNILIRISSFTLYMAWLSTHMYDFFFFVICACLFFMFAY